MKTTDRLNNSNNNKSPFFRIVMRIKGNNRVRSKVPGAVTQTGMRLKAFAKSGVEAAPTLGEATTLVCRRKCFSL